MSTRLTWNYLLTHVDSWYGLFPHGSMNFKKNCEVSLDISPHRFATSSRLRATDKPYEGGILQVVRADPSGLSLALKNFSKNQ